MGGVGSLAVTAYLLLLRIYIYEHLASQLHVGI